MNRRRNRRPRSLGIFGKACVNSIRQYVGVSAKEVGVLTAVEMLAATLCIIPASHYADRYGREPFVIITFIMFTMFPISLLISRTFAALVIAFAIRGFKEFGDTSR